MLAYGPRFEKKASAISVFDIEDPDKSDWPYIQTLR